MPETGKGGPKAPFKYQHKTESKPWSTPTNEVIGERVKSLYDAGLPDTLIARQLELTIPRIKSIRKQLGLPSKTSTESRLAREDFLRKHPNPSHDINPPPLEGFDEEK